MIVPPATAANMNEDIRIREGGDGRTTSEVGQGGVRSRLSPASFCASNTGFTAANSANKTFSPPPPLNQPSKILRTYVRDPSLSGLVHGALPVQKQHFQQNRVVQQQQQGSSSEGFYDQNQYSYTNSSTPVGAFVPNSAPQALSSNSHRQPYNPHSVRPPLVYNTNRQPFNSNPAQQGFLANSIRKPSTPSAVSEQPLSPDFHKSSAYSPQHRSPSNTSPSQSHKFQQSSIHESPRIRSVSKSRGQVGSSSPKHLYVANISQGSLTTPVSLPNAGGKQLPVSSLHFKVGHEQLPPPFNGVNQSPRHTQSNIHSVVDQTLPRSCESRLSHESRDDDRPSHDVSINVQDQVYAKNAAVHPGFAHSTNRSLRACDRLHTRHDVSLNDQSLPNSRKASSRNPQFNPNESISSDTLGIYSSNNTAPSNTSLRTTQLPAADGNHVPVNKVQNRHHSADGTHSSTEINTSFHGSLNQSIASECSHHSARGSDQASNTSSSESNKIQPAAPEDRWMRHPQPVYANAPPKPKRQNVPFDTSSSSETVHNILPHSHEVSPKTLHALNTSTTERRTPDVYGATVVSKNDYEEMHDLVEKSPQSNDSLRDSCMPNHHHNVFKASEEFPELESFKTIESNNTRATRPQSADILDHHNRARMSYDSGFANDNDTQSPSRVRSQSSMGQEIDYWSEENYAQKMRQSSLYHSKNLALSSHSRSASSMGARVPPAGAATPDLYTTSPRYQRTIPELRERRPSFPANTRDQQNLNQHSGASLQASHEDHNSSPCSNNSTLLNASFADTTLSRSPSARMLGDRKDDSFSSSFTQDPEELDEKKIHLREESMKRLLEWKQRMLQSPLTKKTSPRSACPSPAGPLFGSNMHARQRSKTPDGALNGVSFQSKETMDITRHAHGSVTPTHLLSGSHSEHPRGSQYLDSVSSSRERGNFSKSKSRRSGDKDSYSNGEPQRGSVNNYEPQVIQSSDHHNHACKSHVNSHGGHGVRPDSCTMERPADPSSGPRGASRVPCRPSPQGARDADPYTKISGSSACNNCRRVCEETHAHCHSCTSKQDELRDQRSSNRRRDEVRDGGNRRKEKEARRSASSSRCASYSSDENDRIEDRGSRRKTRRNSRRSSSSEMSSNRKGDPSAKPEVSRRASRKAKVGVASPDYVNFSVLANTDDSQSSNPDKPSPSNLRAEPIFIDNLGNEVKNMILDTSQETAPYTDNNSSLEREILLLTNSEPPIEDSTLVTREAPTNDSENPADLTALKRGKSPANDPRAQRSRSAVDDHCAKYSDSGYDTLRHDHNKRYDQTSANERSVFSGPHQQHAGELSVKMRAVKSKKATRPETWSPGNFSSSYVVHDSVGQVATETDEGANKLNLSNSGSQILYPSADLSLESPKIVRETQEATQRTLVQDRIKAFNKLEECSASSSKSPRRKSVDDSLLNTSGVQSNIDTVTRCEETSDIFVPAIDPKFALSKSTVVKAYEAQVKSVHQFGKNCDPVPDESSDSKSPADIVISRLSRNNLRRFLFEDEAANASKEGENSSKYVERKETESSHGVKDIRASFEPKLQANEVTLNKTHLPKRRPHSNMHMFSGHGPPSKTETELLNYEQSKEFDREGSGESPCNPPRPAKKDFSAKSSLAQGRSVARLGLESEEQMYVNNPYAMHAIDRQLGNPELYMGEAPSEPAPLPPTDAPNALHSNSQLLNAPEENYLPMSPPRKPVHGMMAPSSSCSSLSSKYQVTPEPSAYNPLDNREFEEHTYIEMNGDLPKRTQRQLLALPIQKRSSSAEFDANKFAISQPVESPRYYEIGDKDETQHYEYIYRAASHYEAIYMELPGSRPPGLIEEKPDSSQATFDLKPKGLNQGFSTTLPPNSKKGRSAMNIPSDRSSDADDEASKDLESIDFPKNKRFSLSDTFRPASYYLNGAEPSSDPDGHDSSDSDLVSPPPIPTSPPPLDELDHDCKGSGFEFDNLATPEPPPHLRNALNASRSSRSSKRPSKEELSFPHGNSTLKDSNTYYNHTVPDELSNFGKKSTQERHDTLNLDHFILSSEDQYPISAAYPDFHNKGLDHSHSTLSFNVAQSPLKSNSRIDNSVLDRSQSSSRIDLTLRNFESPGEMHLIPNNNHPSRAFNPRENSRLDDNALNRDSIHGRELDDSSTHDQQWREAVYQNFPSGIISDQSTHTPQVSEARNLSGFTKEASERGVESSSSRALNNMNCSSPAVEKSGHIRDNSTISSFSDTSPRSAPYYYSDVIRDSPDCTSVTVPPKARTGQLNNQRDMENQKRQNIGRKVNRIGMSTPTDQRNLVSELRASAQIFEKNSGFLNNAPEQGVGTSHAAKRAQTPSYDVDARNIYSATMFSKSDPIGVQHVHRRTRSLEGLMDDNNRSSEPLPPEAPETREHNESSVPQRCLSVTSHLSCQSNQDVARFQTKFPSKEMLQLDCSPSQPFGDVQRPDSQASHDPRKQFTSDLDFVSDINQDTNFHDASEAASKWEDDQEWRNQLRRASLRHTKSLETLDENKRLPPSTSELPPCPEQSHPTSTEDRRRSSHGLTQQNMNEYRVDYREGLINPVSKPHSANETLERTRRGLTYLEGYEWDPAEEKFTKPHDSSGSETNDVNSLNQFLDEGLSSLQVEQAPDSEESKLNVLTCSPISSNSVATRDRKSPSLQKTGGSDCPREEHDEQGIQFAGDGRPSVNNRNEDESCGEFSLPRTSVEGQPNCSPVADEQPTTAKQSDVNKLGNNRLESYEGQNSAYNGKYASQNCSVLVYEPLTENQTCQAPPSQANDLQNQAYQRGGNLYSSSSHLGYRAGVNDNLSPYHQAAPQPPNYQETVNNLYRRLSLEQNQYSDQSRGYGNGNSLSHAYPDYNAYSSETSPVHLYGHNKGNHGAYMSSSALRQSMEGAERLSKYHNYDIDKDYPPEDIYKAPGDYSSYGTGLRHLYHKGNLDLSDPDLVYMEQQRVHQQHLLLKEEEELKAEERRRKIISDVVRDGTSSGLAGVSAGELLNKTHEELVLLLIQLRRQHSALQEARKQARAERDAHTNLLNLDSENRDQYLDHLAVLNRHLLELDKQYEMGKPLINLVDNMVKLGTLYRGLDNSNSPSSPTTTHQDASNANDSLEFTRRVQERRIVDEDREEYELLTPDQADLEGKVLRLYKLEHAIQQESLTIQALHTEKETLERALLALHSSSSQPPATVEEAQRRERLRMRLERELSQLRSQLALSSGKLEETAAENSRLEHEMMMLRQKIQQTMARNARRDCGDGTSKTRHIESEMLRVQALLEDLQNRRLHLSHQIHKLTMSNSEEKRLYGLHSASPPSMSGSYHSSTGTNRHRSHTTWLETDLDLMITRDLGVDMPSSPLLESDSMDVYRRGVGYDSESPYLSTLYGRSGLRATDGEGYRREYGGIRRHTLDSSYSRRLEPDEPLYSMEPPMALSSGELRNRGYYGVGYDRNAAANKPDGQEQPGVGLRLDDSDDADERMKRFYGLLPKEKSLEPKTVRIVKRESTERRKDRTYSTSSGKKLGSDSPLSHVMEDDLESDSGEQTSEPELDSESSPAHVPLAASMSITKNVPRHHLSSSYSSGYSSSSQTYLPHQQSSYPPSTISLYQSAPDYQSSSVTSVPITTSSSVEPPPMSNSTNLPSYQDRTASLPRNYGRGSEWGDRPNKRIVSSNANSSTSPPDAKTSIASGISTSSRPSNLPLKHKSAWKSKVEAGSGVSAMDQLFGQSPPVSPGKPQPPSPVFKSAAAQEIIKEMVSEAEKYRRTVPKEKRRHVTISSSKPITMETSRDSLEEGARSRDDCDMARALRPRNHPDVVKSTLSTRDLRINETTIDSIFGAPSKIHIPERYVPDEDDSKDVSPEERRRREDKALSIRRMLTESSTNLAHEGAHEQQASEWVKEGSEQNTAAESASKAKERKEREHILAMNQILARQVMEKSRLVAASSTSASPDHLSGLQF